MPILGNNVPGVVSVSLTKTDLFGHFDPAFQIAWGNPLPRARINSWWARMVGPPGPNPNATAQLALYDSSGGIPANYPLVTTSPTFNVPVAAPAQWFTVGDSQVIAAGSYCLAILSNSFGSFTGSVFFTVKAVGASIRAFIVAGVFPNPLNGAPTNGNQDWSIYIDWSPAAGDDPALMINDPCGGDYGDP